MNFETQKKLTLTRVVHGFQWKKNLIFEHKKSYWAFLIVTGYDDTKCI